MSDEPTLYERVKRNSIHNVAPYKVTIVRTRRPGGEGWWAMNPEGRAVHAPTFTRALELAEREWGA